MNIAFVIRSDWRSKPGGDTVQLEKTQAALSGLGGHSAVVTATSGLDAGMAPPDVVHVFNVDRATESLAVLQSLQGRFGPAPIVLSSIYQPRRLLQEGLRHSPVFRDRILHGIGMFDRLDLLEIAKSVKRHGLFPRGLSGTGFRSERGAKETLLARCSGVVVLGHYEAGLLAEDFPQIRGKPLQVIPNGVDTISPAAAPRQGMVCVGRIEPRKNQVFVAKAALAAGLPVLFLGGASPNYPGYTRLLGRYVESSAGLLQIRQLSHQATLAAMAQAKVSVLASWSEVLPLVDFEAYQAGCRLLTTVRSCSPEYLPGDAEGEIVYFDPAGLSVAGLAEAMSASINRPDHSARARLSLPAWPDVAARLLRFYQGLT